MLVLFRGYLHGSQILDLEFSNILVERSGCFIIIFPHLQIVFFFKIKDLKTYIEQYPYIIE